jgi:hypothetical protein
MQLLFKLPRLGFKAGQVGEVKNIGVAKTLISFGVAIEHIEVKDEVVPTENGGKPSATRNRKRAKGPSKRSSE